jgi:predicted transcriptional regulator
MADQRHIEAAEALARLHPMLQLLAPALSLEILAVLGEGELDTTALTDRLGRDMTQVSRQLQALLAIGVLVCKRADRRHVYRLAPDVRYKMNGAVIELTIDGPGGSVRLTCDYPSLIEPKPLSSDTPSSHDR